MSQSQVVNTANADILNDMTTVTELNLTPAAFKAAKLKPVPREVVVRDIQDHIGDSAIGIHRDTNRF